MLLNALSSMFDLLHQAVLCLYRLVNGQPKRLVVLLHGLSAFLLYVLAKQRAVLENILWLWLGMKLAGKFFLGVGSFLKDNLPHESPFPFC